MTGTMAYTPHEIDAIAGWLKEDLSASQVAAELSSLRQCAVSRNAIIGIVHRNETLAAIGFSRAGHGGGPNKALPRRPAPPARPEKTQRFEPGARRYRDLSHAEKTRLHPEYLPNRAFLDATLDMPPIDKDLLMLRAPTPPPRPKPVIKPAVYDAGSRRLPITELAKDQCRFPVNDAPPGGLHLFCGEIVSGETSYCAHHAARCFGGFSARAASRSSASSSPSTCRPRCTRQ
ncbi:MULTISPECIES: GcrA family cell cycle regulator [Mesorhizobium]|uniref:GcrA family cell cycle regulator n=1 Tax=Mesorhizobium TaxID=68287 RepID=UPI0010A96CC1|nr:MULTISPECIES: GcrA family cell cycle regulator [Mesorhizobium]